MTDLVEFGVTTKFTAPVFSVAVPSHVVSQRNPFIQVNLLASSTASALVLDASTETWVFEAVKRLEALGRLRRNWDSYDGLPLSPKARLITFDALGWLKTQDLPIPAVVLGSDGTVHLEWRAKGKELDVGFNSTGTLEYAKMDSQGNIHEGAADAEIRERLCTLTSWLKCD